MRSSRPPDRRWPPLVLAVVAAVVAAGCGGSGRHASAPTTTLLGTDTWTPPAVTGPPSQAGFCALITAMYDHEAELPLATQPVRIRIVDDFVAAVPAALAAAPPDIAPAARTYLTSLARVLDALARAGLDYRKVPAATLTPMLLDPGIKAAGAQVLEYVRTACHYTIGGGPTPP